MGDTTTTPATTSNPPGYDPNNPAPYVAPTPSAPPEITAPPPSPLAQGDPNASGRQPVFGTGKMATAGSIAYIGDSILRGAMQGRERAQQMRVIKAKKLMDGFKYAKDQADAQILDMVQKPELQSAIQKRQKLISSKNPEDATALTDADKKILSEYDNAVNASNAAWQGLNQLQGQYLFGGEQKKGKGKKGQQDSEDPMAMAASNDPETKLRGIFLVRQKLGNPVQYQVRDLLSKLEQQRPGLEHQQTMAKLQSRFDTLNAIPDANLTPEQRTEKADVVRQIEAQKEAAAPYGKNLDKKQSTFVGADNKEHIIWQRPDGSTYETVSGGEVRAPASVLKPRHAWSKDAQGRLYSVNLDPQTNQPVAGTENYAEAVPNSILPATIKSGEFTFVDDQGRAWSVPRTTVTTHTGGAGAGAGAGASTGSSSVSTHTSTAGKPTGATPTPATETPARPIHGARLIGSKGPTGQTKSRADAADSVLLIIPRVRELIKDPEVSGNLGILPGAFSQLEQKMGDLPPKLRELVGLLKSIYSFAGTMHGWRSLKVAEEFEKAYGGLRASPDSLLAGMDAMSETANDVYKTGYKRDWSGGEARKPAKGDKRTYQGHEYTFDGTQWVREGKSATPADTTGKNRNYQK